jgi:hypothetical protein
MNLLITVNVKFRAFFVTLHEASIQFVPRHIFDLSPESIRKHVHTDPFETWAMSRYHTYGKEVVLYDHKGIRITAQPIA